MKKLKFLGPVFRLGHSIIRILQNGSIKGNRSPLSAHPHYSRLVETVAEEFQK